MKIKELIELLQQIEDQDALVVMSRDSEGNSFSPLAEPDYNENWRYFPDSTWSGEMQMTKLTDEWIEQGFTDEDVVEDTKGRSVSAVVLWPVN